MPPNDNNSGTESGHNNTYLVKTRHNSVADRMVNCWDNADWDFCIALWRSFWEWKMVGKMALIETRHPRVSIPEWMASSLHGPVACSGGGGGMEMATHSQSLHFPRQPTLKAISIHYLDLCLCISLLDWPWLSICARIYILTNIFWRDRLASQQLRNTGMNKCRSGGQNIYTRDLEW